MIDDHLGCGVAAEEITYECQRGFTGQIQGICGKDCTWPKSNRPVWLCQNQFGGRYCAKAS